MYYVWLISSYKDSQVVVTETVCPIKPETFTLCLFPKNFALNSNTVSVGAKINLVIVLY